MEFPHLYFANAAASAPRPVNYRFTTPGPEKQTGTNIVNKPRWLMTLGNNVRIAN